MEKLNKNLEIHKFLISEMEKGNYDNLQHSLFVNYINQFPTEELKNICYTILLLKNDYKFKAKLSNSKKEKDSFIFYSELLEIYYDSAINILALYGR